MVIYLVDTPFFYYKEDITMKTNVNRNTKGSPVIYLSPSNQPFNRYVVGDTNEKKEMEELAKQIQRILQKEYDCTVIMATFSLGIDTTSRPKEAKDQGANIYVAIHSNAGGGGQATGAMAFYHPKSTLSKELAQQMVEELNIICPIPSNRTTSYQSGMDVFGGVGYAEIRLPYKYGLCPVLVETNFHDHPQIAKWMIDHKHRIANGYIQALVKVLGLVSKMDIGKGKKESEDRYYRVQVGAFLEKANAEKLQRKLKVEGYDAIIKK